MAIQIIKFIITFALLSYSNLIIAQDSEQGDSSLSDIKYLPFLPEPKSGNSNCFCAESKDEKFISVAFIEALIKLSSHVSETVYGSKNANITNKNNLNYHFENPKKYPNEESFTHVTTFSFGPNNNIKINYFEEGIFQPNSNLSQQKITNSYSQIFLKNPQTLIEYTTKKNFGEFNGNKIVSLTCITDSIYNALITLKGEHITYNPLSMNRFNLWFIYQLHVNGFTIFSDGEKATLTLCIEKKKILENLLSQQEKYSSEQIEEFQRILSTN